MLNGWKEKVQTAAQAAEPKQAPQVVIPDGAGTSDGRLVLIQCVVTCLKKVSGCVLNACDGAFHRIEIVRLIPVEDWEDGNDVDAIDALIRRRVGKVSEDQAYRSSGRKTALLKRVSPTVLEDARPWVQAYNGVGKALTWAATEAVRFKGEQFAVLMVVSIDEGRVVTPNNPNYNEYTEYKIQGVFACEAVRLTEEAQPSVGVDDEEADDLEGYTWGD